MANPIETTEKKPRHRSPAYPTVGLREAVERVGKLYKTDGKAGAPSKLAAVHIGFATAHGQALSALAALKKFGLVAESGNRIVPTQRAIEILNLPANDPRRIQAVKDAALAPEIYRELIEQHRDTGWPADDVLQADLITYKSFNPHSVAGFVKDFKDTLEFAGLSDFGVLGSEPAQSLKVGDYVQWESQGVLQFDVPRKVTGISADGGFVLVEGSTTGIPMEQVSKSDPSPIQQDWPPPKQIKPAFGIAREVFALEDGEAVLQWPTSLNADDVQELEDWLALVVKKLKRLKAKQATD